MKRVTALIAATYWISASAAFAQEHVTQATASFIFNGDVILAEGNTYREDILRALGARYLDGIFNSANARALVIHDLGPASADAGALVRNLLAVGYPAEKVRYYRGGMQVWSVPGLSIEVGAS